MAKFRFKKPYTRMVLTPILANPPSPIPKLRHRLLVLLKTNKYMVPYDVNQNLTPTNSKATTTKFPPQFLAPASTVTVAYHHHYLLLIMANKMHIWVLTNLSQSGRKWR
ncbi:Hypothetical predicted protein [Olea europaea subsp. europaea]|uniref:Uncharacterized protein n=1 Tax=Olea europaea subsp. europaea TaxID=158383 RepID=A0A8S0PGP4_OLEEU|nr:Hypothetical predicted protein [Olea europaea subsp. europaea]